MIVVGLISGTSTDGINAAVVMVVAEAVMTIAVIVTSRKTQKIEILVKRHGFYLIRAFF